MGRGNVKVSIQSAFDDKGVRKAETSLDHLNTHAKRSFGEATKHALGYGAALVGGAGIVGGLEAVVHASLDAEASQAKVKRALQNAGLEWSKYGGHIDAVIEKQSQMSGFAKTDLQDSFANMIRTTGNVNVALKLNSVAMDVARTKGTGLVQAQSILARVYNGSFIGLKRLGIGIEPVTKAQDKLKESTKHATDEQKRAAKEIDKRATVEKALTSVQQKFAGQAQAYGKTTAGSLDKMKEAVNLLEVKLGNALAPTIKDVATKMANFVNQMREGKGAGGRFADQMDRLWQSLKPVLKVVVDTAKWLAKHPALLKAAAGAWIAYKTAAITQLAIVQAAQLGLFGPKLRAKMAGEAKLSGRLAGRAFGAAIIAGAVLAVVELGPQVVEKLKGYIDDIHIGVKFTPFPHLEVKAGPYANIPKGAYPTGAPFKPNPDRQPIGDGIGYGGGGGGGGSPAPVVVPRGAFSHSGGGGTGWGFTNKLTIPGGGGGGGGRGSTFNVVGNGGRIIGTPGVGTHYLGQNWQSSNAIDIAVPIGTPVYAAGGGIITRAGLLPGAPGGRFAGQRVQIGNQFWYGHLSSLTVKEGQRVSAGDLIGYSGSANGVSHLHFASRTGTPHERYSGSQSGDVMVWRVCTLTWYDPALGGINTGGGSKDPYHPTASGENYNPKAYTCAAPRGFAFGTLITFAYGDRFVTCKVNDRGGAITGHHFDLSRAAAAALGVMAEGAVTGKYALPGKSRSIKKAKTPFDKLQNQLGYIDLETQAGVLTQRQSDNAIIQAVNKALPNLTGSNKLRAMGDKRQARQDLRSLRPKPIKPVKQGFDRTINNQWLQAWIQHQQDLMDAGLLDPIVGRDNIANELDQFANWKGVSEHDRLSAIAQAQDLRFQNLADLTPQPTIPGYDKAQADLALAGLTKTTGDDLAALNTLKGIDTGQLNDAISKNDFAGIQQWASELKGVQDSIDNLDGTIDNTNALLQQQIDVEKERSAQLERALAVAQSEERTLGRSLANQLGLTFGIRAGMGKLLPTVGASQ